MASEITTHGLTFHRADDGAVSITEAQRERPAIPGETLIDALTAIGVLPEAKVDEKKKGV